MNVGQTVLIASGGSLSAAVDISDPNGAMLLGLAIPSAWTTANLTFQVSWDGGATYNNFYDMSGAEVTAVVTAASTHIALDPSLFAGLRFIKIRSGTSGSAVNQGADRLIGIFGRKFA